MGEAVEMGNGDPRGSDPQGTGGREEQKAHLNRRAIVGLGSALVDVLYHDSRLGRTGFSGGFFTLHEYKNLNLNGGGNRLTGLKKPVDRKWSLNRRIGAFFSGGDLDMIFQQRLITFFSFSEGGTGGIEDRR